MDTTPSAPTAATRDAHRIPSAPAPDEGSPGGVERLDVVVVGGSQAGLAVGHELLATGRSFAVLDAKPRVGDAWRSRWDSLVLFTPSQFNGLPGMRYPAPAGRFCTKDEFADYLESYARHFRLPVRTSTRVTRVGRVGDRFLVQTDRGTIEAQDVVVAMGTHQRPRVPGFAADLDPAIQQLTPADYQRPDQVGDGPVLVVGSGNSGADIAMDLVAAGRDVTIAGTPPGVIPFRIEGFLARHVLVRMVRFVGHRVLNVRNPLGRRLRPLFLSKGTPLIRVKPADLEAAGVQRVGRVTGVRGGRPCTEDGTVLDVATVLWCTGFRPSLGWIDLPVLGDGGHPLAEGGEVPSVPGLWFVGVEYQQSETSGTITGLARDARHVVRRLDRRTPRRRGRAAARAA